MFKTRNLNFFEHFFVVPNILISFLIKKTVIPNVLCLSIPF